MPLPRRALLRHALTGVCATCPVPAVAHARHRTARHRHHARPLPLVVIDPGHGGKDPGCSGHLGTYEKTIALELGLELRRQLHAGGRCRVAMTRSTDVFVPLQQRVRFARTQNAALFVSLHANAAPHDRHAHGACVYRFAYRASDAKTRALAKWENSADRYGGPAFRDASPALTHILASLMRKETWKHSAWLQQGMVDTMHRHVALTPVPARHARFVVLSAPDIASVLVEIGFLTNAKEERLLRSRSHRHQLALALRHAVEHTLARMPHDGAA